MTGGRRGAIRQSPPGARHIYISNLPLARAQAVMAAVLDKAGVTK